MNVLSIACIIKVAFSSGNEDICSFFDYDQERWVGSLLVDAVLA